MTKAYRLENINIQNNTDYYLKCFVDIKFNTSGKYWWGVKPSALGWDKGYYIDPWWDSGWTYYRTLTINPTYIEANLANFTVLVNVSAAISAVCNNGNSIRFLNTDNTTEYYYEIEDTWNASSYNFVWVNVTSISSSVDTRFLMYYGNGDATDNQDATNVWDANYLGVYHLNESSGSTCYDSTGRSNDGTYKGDLPTRVTGQVGYGQDLDGTGDNVSLPSGVHAPTVATYEIWFEADAINTIEHLYANWQDSSNYVMVAVYDGIDGYRFLGKYSGGTQLEIFSGSRTTGFEYHGAAFQTNDGVLIVNDSFIGIDTSITPAAFTFTGTTLGNSRVAGTAAVDGVIDEARISNIRRSNAWLNASFHSQNQTPGFLTVGSAITTASTTINATTGIEETNATLHGYIFGIIGTGNYNYGFWIGTSTPVTEANADRNMTGSGYVTITGNSDFSHNDTNLSIGTQYYAKSWIRNATHWASSSNEEDFWTKCNAPTGLTATLDGCSVDLAWTKGTGADRTTIARKVDSYPTSQTDGTVVYNNTASSYSDTTGNGSHQYYRAWSWAGDKHSDANVSTNLMVPPCPPTSVTGSVLANNTLNISWTKGIGAITTLVVRKTDSSPATVTDGTVMYNNTGTYYIATDLTENYYYALWSYANETYSSSVAFDFGALVINCYSEETNASLYFDALVRNESGTQSYESRNNTNPLVINVADDLPLGDDIRIIISPAQNYSDKTETFTGYSFVENLTVTYVILLQPPESKALTNVTCRNATASTNSYPAFTLADDVITILGDAADEFSQITVNYTHYEYDSRTYYRDLVGNHVYVLDAFLPDADETELYVLQIIDDYDIPVERVDLEIKRSINGSYEIIASPITDANGKVNVYLTPNEDHLVRISKDNFETKNASFIPDPDYYGSYYPIIFRITYEEEDIEPETVGDYVTITGTLYANDTLNVTYYEMADETINTHFYIYEYYNNTRTYIGEYNGTTSNDFEFWKSSLNTSRMHLIVLFMNHTTLGEIENYTIYVMPLHEDKESGESLETHFIAVFGNWEYGFVNTIIWYFPSIIFILAFAAVHHPGMGVLFAGMYCMFVSWYLLMPDEAALIMFASIAVVIGMIGIFLKRGREMIH